MKKVTTQETNPVNGLKKSKYAMFIKEDNGSYIIYSSMNCIVIRCMKENQLEKLTEILNNDEIIYDENNDVHKLFLERGILVDINENEKQNARYMYEQKILNNRILKLMVVVTRQCNLRCVYCGQEHLNLKMDRSVYERILKFIDNTMGEKSYNAVSVSFFGGEPLLEDKNIITFLEDLTEITRKNNSGFSSGMSTNGLLLTPERFRKLTELNCRGYQISVDGMDYTHNKTRP
jgi:uncharacterized protein